MENITWLGEKECNFCNERIHGILFDAKTKYGPWATMCEKCHEEYSGYAPRYGFCQKYKENAKGEFELVEGGSEG